MCGKRLVVDDFSAIPCNHEGLQIHPAPQPLRRDGLGVGRGQGAKLEERAANAPCLGTFDGRWGGKDGALSKEV